ncbi:MAG: SIS domain-containing protein [Treponema sp.]|jgi:fructoselysine 6-phosphate deglycase|nr:SIS domain-containing protein [Treponema sp.]
MKQIIETVEKVKKDFDVRGGLKNIFFVACGDSLAAMYPANYLIDREGTSVYSTMYNSGEFVSLPPKTLGKNTLVICTSTKATPETVEAIKTANERGALTIGLTGYADSATARTARYSLVYNHKDEWNSDSSLVTTNSQSAALKLAFGILRRFENYPSYQEAIKAFSAMGEIYAGACKKTADRKIAFALDCKDDEVFNVIGSGPLYATAYVDAFCFLEEMQHRHCVPVHGGEYFHGPFETLERNLPVILLMGAGPTRPLDERDKRFLEKFCSRLYVLDALELGLGQLDPAVAEYFNTLLIHPLSKQYFAELAAIRQHPLTYRRYMWKTEY